MLTNPIGFKQALRLNGSIILTDAGRLQSAWHTLHIVAINSECHRCIVTCHHKCSANSCNSPCYFWKYFRCTDWCIWRCCLQSIDRLHWKVFSASRWLCLTSRTCRNWLIPCYNHSASPRCWGVFAGDLILSRLRSQPQPSTWRFRSVSHNILIASQQRAVLKVNP
jgi:hypothetical protein